MTDAEFVKEADDAVRGLEAYLQDRRAGKPGPGTTAQLEGLIDYLRGLAGHVKSGRFPPASQRHAKSLGWIVVDEWDPNDPLGERILNLNSWYLNR
jgi:hypothetical protein